MNKFRQFMATRYGPDQLNSVLIYGALVLDIIGIFTSWFPTILAAIPLGFGIFRMFSGNIAARRAENEKFLAWWARVRAWFRRGRNRAAQSKDYRFYKCPSCGQSVRVPRGKGKIRITCPKCGTQFEKKT